MNRRKIAIIALLAGAAGIFLTVPILLYAGRSNRFVLRNATTTDVSDIRLLVTRYGSMERTVPRLPAGGSETVNHRIRDAGGTLDFLLNGKRHRCEFFVDYWPGEGWVFEFQPDGTVKQGYDYPGYQLQHEQQQPPTPPQGEQP